MPERRKKNREWAQVEKQLKMFESWGSAACLVATVRLLSLLDRADLPRVTDRCLLEERSRAWRYEGG